MTQLHADEAPIDDAMVRRLVAKQFPQWSGLPLKRFPSTGTVNVIYRLGAGLGVRLPRREGYAQSIDRECEWLPRLGPNLPLRVPEPVGRGVPGEGFPFEWAVFRWIEGEPFDAANVTDPDAAAVELAAFVRALHAVAPDGAPKASRREPLKLRDEVTRKAISQVADVLDPGVLIRAWESALTAPEWDRAPGWIHGDLLPGNVLTRDGRMAAVIDFGGSGLGDPAADLLPAWSLFPAGPRETYRRALVVDEGTWDRGRGWALSVALLIIPYYRETNAAFSAMATGMVRGLLEEFESRDPGS